MDTLQQIFEKEIMGQFAFSVVGTKIIKKQLEKKGVFLNENQIDKLERKLQYIGDDTLKLDFDFDDEQIKILGISKGETIEIDISDSDKEIDEIYQEFVANSKETIPKIINEMASSILFDLKESSPAKLKENRREKKNFEHRLDNDWKKPFDMFEMFLIIAFEAGDEFNNNFRNEAAENQNYVFEVLTRLHARACQIASEILVLLKSGYADGAHARWRSLHEIAVVGSFIKTHGNEIAERYLLHNNIESFKVADDLHRYYYEKLGNIPFPQDEYDSLKAMREQLITRFGNPYKNLYGWASSALSKDNPTFRDIEKNSGLDYLRPYYQLASHNVHANPKGVMFKLGLFPNTQNILLAGPSNTGFTDPAQDTIISLGLITITLITTKPTIDNLVLSNILLKLGSEIGEEFLKVQKEIENSNAT